MERDDATSLVLCPCLPPVPADIPPKPSGSYFSYFRFVLSWLYFLVSFPFVVMFTWTIPNCSTPETKKYYLVSFTMSIVWIAALSFGMVTLVGRAGCILGVDKFTMGLVVVAIGTSIPVCQFSITFRCISRVFQSFIRNVKVFTLFIWWGLWRRLGCNFVKRNYKPLTNWKIVDSLYYESQRENILSN